MQTGPIPNHSIRWLPIATKAVIGLAGVTAIALAISFLEYSPPRLPEPPLYRIAPGISGIGFYNDSCSQRDSKRIYRYYFMIREVRCIYAEIYIPPDTPEAHGHTFFYDPSGQVMGGSDFLITKEPAVTEVYVYTGWNKLGHWRPGIYRVEFVVEEKVIAADEFQIRDP